MTLTDTTYSFFQWIDWKHSSLTLFTARSSTFFLYPLLITSLKLYYTLKGIGYEEQIKDSLLAKVEFSTDSKCMEFSQQNFNTAWSHLYLCISSTQERNVTMNNFGRFCQNVLHVDLLKPHYPLNYPIRLTEHQHHPAHSFISQCNFKFQH